MKRISIRGLLTVLVLCWAGLAEAQIVSGGNSASPPCNISFSALYVSPLGNDSNPGLTPGQPLLTINRAISLLPVQVLCNNVTIHISPGTAYGEAVTINGVQVINGYKLTLQGYINSTPGQFTNAAALTGTSSGSNTNNWPATTNTLFNDTTLSPFGAANTKRGWFLRLTAGTGFDATNDDNNWYVVSTNTSSSVLSVIGNWRGSTPDGTTGYQLYNPASITTVTCGGSRAYGINVSNSLNIVLRGLGATACTNAGFAIFNSQLNSGASTHTAVENAPAFTSRDMFLLTSNSNTSSLARGFRIESSSIGTMDVTTALSNDGVGYYYGNGTVIVNFLNYFGYASANNQCVSTFNNVALDRVQWGETSTCGIFGLDFENSTSVGFLMAVRSVSNTSGGMLIANGSNVTLGSASVFDSNTVNGISITTGSILANPLSIVGVATNNGAYGIGMASNGMCTKCNLFTATGNALGASAHRPIGSALIYSGDHVAKPTATTGCGGSPTTTGTDWGFTVTIGTAPGATCLITYNVAYNVAPSPLCINVTTGAAQIISSPAVGSFTLGGTFAAGDVINCLAFPKG